MQRVATFSRVSTMDQHSSIENQEEVFKYWFKNNKNCILKKSYVDEGISGAKGYKRIEWNNMIKAGENKEFDILVCKSFSRFGRNQRETLDAINKLRIAGVRTIFLEDNLDSEKDMANFGLMAWLAEKEANSASERIKMVWDNFNMQGKIHSPIPIYGYNYDKNIKNYLINELEASVVKEIFNMYISGYGYNKICNTLIEKNIPTKRGGKWQGNTIAKMIINEFYIGTLVQGKSRTYDATTKGSKKIKESDWFKHENHHDSIIDKETFVTAQIEMKKRRERCKKLYAKDGIESRNSNKNLFSNLLVCGDCNNRMYAKKLKKIGYKTRYNCLAYERLGTKCGHTSNSYKEEDLQLVIRNELEDLSDNNFNSLKAIKYKNENNIYSYKLELKKIENNINKQVEIANQLMINYSNSFIKQELYILQNEKINNTLKNLIEQKNILEKRIESSKKIIEKDTLYDGMKCIINTPFQKWSNSMLKEIINNITLKTNGEVSIELKYFQ